MSLINNWDGDWGDAANGNLDDMFPDEESGDGFTDAGSVDADFGAGLEMMLPDISEPSEGMREVPQILLIGDMKSFMVNAIAKDLSEIGFSVTQVLPWVKDVRDISFRPDVYLVYLDNVNNFNDVLVYLDMQVLSSDIKICFIGEKAQIDKAYLSLPKERVEESFVRPVNIKELGERLENLIEKGDSDFDAKHILVVDDDGMMLKAIKSWLDSRYRVTIVNSAMSAIKFLATNKVDLILLDYEMPVTTGPQAFEMLRSDPDTKDIPVMFLTVKSDKESVMRVLELKPESYLLKTMPPKELVAAIDNFFVERKALQNKKG